MEAHENREPTLADVARESGVSVTTVSRVLNNRGYLSQQTKDKVAAAMAKLGYQPNQMARALHGRSSQTIGLIVPSVALPFFGELAVHVENALAEHGYRILICNSLGQEEREREYLNLLVGNRVDGIISGAHNENLEEYSSVRMPLVTIDRDLAPHVPNVCCDNLAGGKLATAHLLERGAKRPVLLTSRTGKHNLRERGYREVLAQAGIAPLIATVDFHTPPAERQERINAQLDGIEEEFDAVFATDDLAAAEVLEWARLRCKQVPGDLRVVGFDGTTALRRALPGLTTVAQPLEAIAQSAVEILLEQIRLHSRDRASFTKQPLPSIALPVQLVKGWTS
ncbi:MAG: LacI family DNA-binding transcriptional regulator [Buchananella hordeovulneris]|nr:LacI family DNA-binding transcriptional regulator [Buchananella hordeovulneris]